MRWPGLDLEPAAVPAPRRLAVIVSPGVFCFLVSASYSWRVGGEGYFSGGNAESAPELVVRSQGHHRSLPGTRPYVVGRDPGCDVVIADPRVSWHHLVLKVDSGRWVLEDSNSTNGTYAAGRRADRIEISTECLV